MQYSLMLNAHKKALLNNLKEQTARNMRLLMDILPPPSPSKDDHDFSSSSEEDPDAPQLNQRVMEQNQQQSEFNPQRVVFSVPLIPIRRRDPEFTDIKDQLLPESNISPEEVLSRSRVRSNFKSKPFC